MSDYWRRYLLCTTQPPVFLLVSTYITSSFPKSDFFSITVLYSFIICPNHFFLLYLFYLSIIFVPSSSTACGVTSSSSSWLYFSILLAIFILTFCVFQISPLFQVPPFLNSYTAPAIFVVFATFVFFTLMLIPKVPNSLFKFFII